MALRHPWLISSCVALGTLMVGLIACGDDEVLPATGTAGAGGNAGGGGTGGASAGSAGAAYVEPHPAAGEACTSDGAEASLQTSIPSVHVAVGHTRSFDLHAAPDVCARTDVSLTIASGAQALIGQVGGAIPATVGAATATASIDLRHPTIRVEVKGVAAGQTTLTASFTLGGKTTTVTVPVDVREASLPVCSGQASGQVKPGETLGGTTALGGASLGLQARADTPAQATVDGALVASPTLWKVDAFDATVSCAPSVAVPAGYTALGPAVTFGPEARRFPREVPMAVPINPALLPDAARLRHVRIVYSGPAFKTPRPIPVADLSVEQTPGGDWVARFLAPRLGTYQAVVATDAGTRTFKRHLTHRAIIGISMGGGGSAMFGSKHHDMFDVLAPLGGPVDWTYMLNHIEHNQSGGFLPNDGTTVPTGFAPLPTPTVPYEHPSSYNTWWYEFPKEGNGGTFSRNSYTQIFRDLSLMFGNPNGDNKFPGGEHLPSGVNPQDPSVRGDVPEGDCTVVVEPTGQEPNAAVLQALENKCPASRCAHTQVLDKFYDGRFNPKGTWPVITVCDGGPQDKSKSPYANQWNGANEVPFEVGLAVDYNKNGKRDIDEPIITQGHEPFRDVGTDGLASVDEAGYQVGVNEDPAGDDYDPQYNPTGTENDGRYQQGEPFDDFGLDGVASTKDSPYDVGEGDGVFTMSTGLKRFLDQDAHSLTRQWATSTTAGPIDDKALQRLDLWVDGGYRDLFNFSIAGQHLTGAYAARGRDVGYYSSPTNLPGQVTKTGEIRGQDMQWDSLPGVVLMRYGQIDPTVADLNSGTGQHVGAVPELTARLQAPLFYLDRRWTDAQRTFVDDSQDEPDPARPSCEISGTCNYAFKDSRGREGPVAVSLPPGYGNIHQKDTRYPVVYMLHGYGQSPEDLSAIRLFLNVWMNSSSDSSANRLGKYIVVYVDGRCRLTGDGSPECIRGTFYADSPRQNGGKLESWFLELMKDVETRYRTMGPSDVDWTE